MIRAEPAHVAPDARKAGHDDAHDDHAAGASLAELETRLDWMTSHLHDDAFNAYVVGYAAAVISIRLTTEATTSTQTLLAFTTTPKGGNHHA